MLSALGNLYYENGRYLEAVDAFREAEALAAPAWAEAVVLRDHGVKASGDLPTECRRSGPEYGLAQIAVAAKQLEPPRTLRCLDAALEMALSVRARRGNALYLIGNPDSALAEHRRVLQASADYPESLFFVGAILLEQSQGDKAKLEEGKSFWKRLLVVAPDHPRAGLVKDSLPRADEIFAAKPEKALPAGLPQAAQGELPAGHPQLSANTPGAELNEGGGSPMAGAAPGGPMTGNKPGAPLAHTGAGPSPDLISSMQEAAANTERTPELEKGLDELLVQGEKALDEGRYQDARDAIVRVMPMRPGDARTAAGLGGAMRGLGRAEMAERTLPRALPLDPKQPRALLELGKLEAARGGKDRARASFQALRAADAKFASAHGVDEELRKLQ